MGIFVAMQYAQFNYDSLFSSSPQYFSISLIVDIQTSAEAVENTREMFLRAGFAPVLVQIVYLVSPSFQQPRQALEDALQSLCNLAFNYNGQIELTKPELRLVSTLYFRMELDSHVAEIQGKICRLLLALAHENSKTQVRRISSDGF